MLGRALLASPPTLRLPTLCTCRCESFAVSCSTLLCCIISLHAIYCKCYCGRLSMCPILYYKLCVDLLVGCYPALSRSGDTPFFSWNVTLAFFTGVTRFNPQLLLQHQHPATPLCCSLTMYVYRPEPQLALCMFETVVLCALAPRVMMFAFSIGA
jgi:hypothetical protein